MEFKGAFELNQATIDTDLPLSMTRKLYQATFGETYSGATLDVSAEEKLLAKAFETGNPIEDPELSEGENL